MPERIRDEPTYRIGFEGGLAFILVPVVAWWMGIGLVEALVLDLGLLVFFLVYTFVFNLAFDRIFGLPAGHIAPGQPADLMLFDAGAPWRIDADATLASAGNTPFDGMPTQGRVSLTMKGGETVWRRA